MKAATTAEAEGRTDPGSVGSSEGAAAGLLFVAGLLLRLALARRAPITGDSLRFLSQARDLASGSADLIPGDPFSAVPPGYPLFIRLVGWAAPGVESVLRAQLVLSVMALLGVWLAARRRSREGALVALAVVALNPWLARQQALVMSETLGAFLVAATILLWPAPGRRLGAAAALALGALGVGASLVTPAAAFVALPSLGVLAWQSRGRAGVIAAIAAGALLVLARGSSRCSRGRAAWSPSSSIRSDPSGPGSRHGSGRGPRRPATRKSGGTPRCAGTFSERAFGRDPERARLRAALAETPYGYAAYAMGSTYDETFRAAARARRAEHPLRSWIALPLVRSASLWLDYRAMIGVPESLRRAGGLLRFSYGAAHAAFWGVNLASLALFVWGAARAARARDALLLAVAAGALAYSLASGASAMGEFRRNLTLLPALSLLACAVPARALPEARNP